MLNVLKEFGFDVPNLIRMGMPPIRIEVLTDISGVSFDECYDKRVTDFIDEVVL